VVPRPARRAEPRIPTHLGYQQKRSRETFERLLAAGEEVIAEKGFDNLSVSEVAARAGNTTGAFYRRFESKEGLLQVLHERYVERMSRAVEKSLAPERWEFADIPEILERWLGETLVVAKRNRDINRASAQRQFTDKHFAAREAMLRQKTYDHLSQLLLLRQRSIGHADPPAAVGFVAHQITAMMNDRFFLEPGPARALPEQVFIEQLVESCVSYLRVRRRRPRS